MSLSDGLAHIHIPGATKIFKMGAAVLLLFFSLYIIDILTY